LYNVIKISETALFKKDNFKLYNIIPSTSRQLTSTDLNRCGLRSAIN